MSLYMVVNEHQPEDCQPMEAGIPKIPAALRGTDFYCTCPGGTHGFFILMEGDSAEQVLGLLPEELFMGSTRAMPLEVFKL